MSDHPQPPDADANTTTSHRELLASDTERAHLRELLKSFAFVMVATYDRKGKHPRLNVRPMYVATLEDDCSVVFITALPSEKVADGHHEEGHVIAQSVTRQVTMYGHFEISTDRARLEKVWSMAMNVWFPKGKDDPNACLLIFHPRDAELWDASGLKGLRFVLRSAKAILTKTSPETSVDQHAMLKLQRA